MRITIGPAVRLIGLLAALLLLASFARADEEAADLSQLPKAITDAVKARFPDAELTSAIKESDKDKVIYDIELKHNGRKCEMDLESNGTVLEVEEELDVQKLPAVVAAAVQSKYPNSTVQEIMEVNKVTDHKETLDHYEVVLETADKKMKEVIASLDGKSVKEEE